MSTSTTETQNFDYVVGLATRFIEEHLDGDPLQWDEVVDHLRARGHGGEPTAAITRAVLDLQLTRPMFYALDGMRRLRADDAGEAPLGEVAAAVLSLEWPCTRNGRPGGSRSIHEAFEELGGRYRHCDVYAAMHGLLKNHELKGGRVWWQRTGIPSRFDGAGGFALRPAVVVDLPQDAPERRELEPDLVAAYVATLPHRYFREYVIGDLRPDVYEPTVRCLVEAKAAADSVTVAHAWAQAAAYSYVLRCAARDDPSSVETIAVLLPAAPTGTVRGFLEHVAADGDGIRREQFT